MPLRHDARLYQIFRGAGATDAFAQTLVDALAASGLELADPSANELVTRWVSTDERAVPADADTIIRTITRTRAGVTESFTHWLDGLTSPRLP